MAKKRTAGDLLQKHVREMIADAGDREMIESWFENVHGDPKIFGDASISRRFPDAAKALRRVATAGLKPADLAPVLRFAAHELVEQLLVLLDDGYSVDDEDETPMWGLVERSPDGTPTGRELKLSDRVFPVRGKSVGALARR